MQTVKARIVKVIGRPTAENDASDQDRADVAPGDATLSIGGAARGEYQLDGHLLGCVLLTIEQPGNGEVEIALEPRAALHVADWIKVCARALAEADVTGSDDD